MTPLPTPSPSCVPNGVSCTAWTLTCTTLGATCEATCATGSFSGTCAEGAGACCATFSALSPGSSLTSAQPASNASETTSATSAAALLLKFLYLPSGILGGRCQELTAGRRRVYQHVRRGPGTLTAWVSRRTGGRFRRISPARARLATSSRGWGRRRGCAAVL